MGKEKKEVKQSQWSLISSKYFRSHFLVCSLTKKSYNKPGCNLKVGKTGLAYHTAIAVIKTGSLFSA